MVLLSIIITLIYLFLIGWLVFGFNKTDLFYLEDIPAKTYFSIIIPFRNEAVHLPHLLASIKTLNYPEPLYEVILIDDASHDGSVDIIKTFIDKSSKNIKLISNKRLSNAPKKDAITTGINIAKYEWIITTDADCTLPKYWLDSFDEYIQKTSASCIAAPVTYHKSNTFLNNFQLLDILSLQGATIGGFGIQKPFLCNGANFGYKKTLFNKLHGFEGNTHITSGDDIFFMEKVVKNDSKNLHYLKCEQAIVHSIPQASWSALISQRLRWASKTSASENSFSKLTGFVVLLMNALIITLCLLTALGNFNLKILLYILFIKLNIDFFLIYNTATFFKQKSILKSVFFGFLIYPFFSVYIVFISLFKTYKWKGRAFRK